MGDHRGEPPRRRIRVRQSSTTTVIVYDGGHKYEKPVQMRAVTLASHRAAYAFRKGAGVKS